MRIHGEVVLEAAAMGRLSCRVLKVPSAQEHLPTQHTASA